MRARTLVLGLVALAGCKKTVDSTGFEKNLDEKVRALGLRPGAIECPHDVEAKAGTKFTCKVPIDKATYGLTVTIKSVDGSVVQMDTAWTEGPAVIRDRLLETVPKAMQDALDAPVNLDCGSEPLIFLQDGKVACSLSSGKAASHLVLKLDEKLEIAGWELVPPLLGKKKLEALIAPLVAEKLNDSVVADCGPEPLIARPADGVLKCSISGAKINRQIRVTVTKDLNIQSWETAALR